MAKENIERIEDVDYVWDGRPYVELTGKPKFYDWIIASHVIEHTPDLIAFLKDCDSILNNKGVISLVVPDARYCFDCFRPITGISKIIDAHLCKNKIHTPGTAAEYLLTQVEKNKHIAWYSGFPGNYSLRISLEETRNTISDIIDNKKYYDFHAWCFTPSSFRLLIHDLHSLQLIPFREVSFFPTEGCEFYITLGRKEKINNFNRLQMLEATKAEIVASSMDSINLEIKPIAEITAPSTPRYQFYELAISAIRIIEKEGWLVFLKKSFRYSTRKMHSIFSN
jgi:hypothetical protein